MKPLLKSVVPEFILNAVSRINESIFGICLTMIRKEQIVDNLNAHGWNVCEISDFYSPLPDVSTLKENMQRWYKPSGLIGIEYDIEAMKQLLKHLISNYYDEYKTIQTYEENKKKNFGPGFTFIDSMILYFMIRDIKPKRCIEIGSGLSTYYCSLAANKNAEIGKPVKITCIDPYPREKLYDIPGIEIIKKEVQDIELSVFDQLDSGDILFIDSTHIVKIDGDVPYLYLEVIPRLKKGVKIHVHDVHFPYNVPYPSEYYIFGWKRPVFWNEAMLLQAFLSFNDAYKIKFSAPLLRYYCEEFLRSAIPSYTPVIQDNTYTHFGSIWIEKVK